MRSRVPLLALLLLAGSFALPHVVHAVIPFFGPIIPPNISKVAANSQYCAASWGMVIVVINNIISLMITLAIVFVAPIMIAWAGFLFVVNPVNASGKEQAKKVLLNTIVGIVIALAGYLIIDALMVAIYNPAAQSGTTKLGAWSQLVTSGGLDPCIKVAGSLNQAQQNAATTTPGVVVTPTPGANCPVPDQSTMATIPAEYVVGGTGLATPTTVQNYLAMRAAALKEGFDLKVSSAYRSDATQVSLWNQYCSSGTCGATLVAKPCSLGGAGSNHNSGQALDLTDGCSNGQACNTTAYQWLKANGKNWGFYNSIPTDGIHWSPSGN